MSVPLLSLSLPSLFRVIAVCFRAYPCGCWGGDVLSVKTVFLTKQNAVICAVYLICVAGVRSIISQVLQCKADDKVST